MDAGGLWHAWLEHYGADYASDEERRAAYRDFTANLAAAHRGGGPLRERDDDLW